MSTLVEQLEKALQKQRPKNQLRQELDQLRKKTVVMQHAKTLPPLDGNGNVLDMRDSGRVTAK